MKATITTTLEFTDKELTDFAERWATKVVTRGMGELGEQLAPFTPVILDALKRAVTASSSAAASPPEEDDEDLCDACKEELSHCSPILSTDGSAKGWLCHECRSGNKRTAARCFACGHERCGPHFEAQPPPRATRRPSPPAESFPGEDAVAVYEQILRHRRADHVTVILQRVRSNPPPSLGEKAMLATRPGSGPELLKALEDFHSFHINPVTNCVYGPVQATYRVSFYSESKALLGEGRVTLFPAVSPPAASAAESPAPATPSEG
jgi:hypothetical protein